MYPDQNNGGQPQFQPVQQPQGGEQQPQQQQQPQQPEPTIDNLIVDNPAFAGQPQQQQETPVNQPVQQPAQQAPQQQGQPQQQPQQQQQERQEDNQPIQYNDPYQQQGGVRTVRANFDKWLDEKYPIKGKLSLDDVDKKDPAKLAQFFEDMQDRTQSDLRNEQARDAARAQFEVQVFEPVYQVFPKLRQDPTTDGLVRMLYRGASADNPNTSPVQVAAAFSNFVRGVYQAAYRSGQANVQQIPSAPVGQQGRAASKMLNNDVVEKMAGGGIEDVASLVAALQGKGVGGL